MVPGQHLHILDRLAAHHRQRAVCGADMPGRDMNLHLPSLQPDPLVNHDRHMEFERQGILVSQNSSCFNVFCIPVRYEDSPNLSRYTCMTSRTRPRFSSGTLSSRSMTKKSSFIRMNGSDT